MKYLILFTFLMNVLFPASMALTPVDKQDVASKNILVNGGFESGKSKWTASGGTFAVTSSSPMIGNSHATWDSGSASQTLTSTAIAIPDGFKSLNGVASCLIEVPTGTATHKLQAYDGTNVVVEQTIHATGKARVSSNFILPSSGNISLRLISVASDEPSIKIDDCHIDLADSRNTSNVSQAKLLGKIRMTGCTDWSRSNTAFGSFSATSGCSYTLTGNALSPATVIPAIRFNSIPPGYLHFVARGAFYKTVSSTNGDVAFRFSDGTNTFGEQGTGHISGGGAAVGLNVLSGSIAYATAQGATTIEIQGRSGVTTTSTAAAISDNIGPNGNTIIDAVEIEVYHYPLASQQAVNSDTQPWRVDANISGANPSLGTSSVASYTEITDASLTLTNNSGSGVLTTQIPCSTTNPPTGTTCSAGSESVGVSFTIPRAGDVKACASFTWQGQSDSSGDSVAAAFQIVETPTNAQTISQEGRSRVNAQHGGVAAVSTATNYPIRICGTFSFSSAGQKVLRLMYEQLVSSTPTGSLVLADASASVGQRDIHWEVYPIDQQFPAPTLVNSVTSQTNGALRIEHGILNCDAGSAITSQSGTWISSIGNISTGACTVTLVSGIFSTAPTCMVSAKTGSTPQIVYVGANSATSLTLGGISDTGANSTTVDSNIICIGPR